MHLKNNYRLLSWDWWKSEMPSWDCLWWLSGQQTEAERLHTELFGAPCCTHGHAAQNVPNPCPSTLSTLSETITRARRSQFHRRRETKRNTRSNKHNTTTTHTSQKLHTRTHTHIHPLKRCRGKWQTDKGAYCVVVKKNWQQTEINTHSDTHKHKDRDAKWQ